MAKGARFAVSNLKYRKPKKSDQDKVEKALQLLLGIIRENEKDIEPTLWVGAMIAALADNYERSGLPYEHFQQAMKECVEHYQY